MKKYLLTILFVLGLISYNSFSASFVLTKFDTLAIGGIDETIAGHAQLANPGILKIEIESIIKVIKITSGHLFSACDGSGICGPLTDVDYKPSETFIIEPASNTGNYINFYMSGNGVAGEDILNAKYWIKGKETDFLEFNIRFIAGTTSVELVNNNSTFASSAFPSIVADYVTIKSDSDLTNSNIVVFDIYGNKILEQNLIGNSNSLNISELSQGTYYYNVIKDGINISTNKFIVLK